MANAVELIINGTTRHFAGNSDRTLLDVLRSDWCLKATRFGCGEGNCGACHVIVDGVATSACGTPMWSVAGKTVVTLEGLGSPEKPHPLQATFIAEQAMQCGYCISGIMITAAAFLVRNPDPSDADVREALAGNLCRCGAHNRIVRAVQKAAEQMRAANV